MNEIYLTDLGQISQRDSEWRRARRSSIAQYHKSIVWGKQRVGVHCKKSWVGDRLWLI